MSRGSDMISYSMQLNHKFWSKTSERQKQHDYNIQWRQWKTCHFLLYWESKFAPCLYFLNLTSLSCISTTCYPELGLSIPERFPPSNSKESNKFFALEPWQYQQLCMYSWKSENGPNRSCGHISGVIYPLYKGFPAYLPLSLPSSVE